MTPKAESNPKMFPKAAIQAVLDGWWDLKTKSPLKKPKPPSETHSKGGSVFDILPELSSQQAVGVLLDLKEHLGYEPSKKLIRRGGYKSRVDFIGQLCDALEKEFMAHYGLSEESEQNVVQEIHAHA
jgi:hypothetical protein